MSNDGMYLPADSMSFCRKWTERSTQFASLVSAIGASKKKLNSELANLNPVIRDIAAPQAADEILILFRKKSLVGLVCISPRRFLPPVRFLGLRCMQQEGAPAGYVRRAPLPAPLRAVCEGEAQLTVTRASQSISPFAPPAFRKSCIIAI